METEQHAAEQPTNDRRNKKRNQNMHRMNENENTTTPNQWDTVKGVLRVRFITIQVYLKK